MAILTIRSGNDGSQIMRIQQRGSDEFNKHTAKVEIYNPLIEAIWRNVQVQNMDLAMIGSYFNQLFEVQFEVDEDDSPY